MSVIEQCFGFLAIMIKVCIWSILYSVGLGIALIVIFCGIASSLYLIGMSITLTVELIETVKLVHYEYKSQRVTYADPEADAAEEGLLKRNESLTDIIHRSIASSAERNSESAFTKQIWTFIGQFGTYMQVIVLGLGVLAGPLVIGFLAFVVGPWLWDFEFDVQTPDADTPDSMVSSQQNYAS